jgi:hypothetical protein
MDFSLPMIKSCKLEAARSMLDLAELDCLPEKAITLLCNALRGVSVIVSSFIFILL